MIPGSFTDHDKQQVVDFLNFIAKKATFTDWTTEDTVKHFKLLAHMQQVILPKIDAHVFEMGKFVPAKDPPKEPAPPPAKPRAAKASKEG